MPITRSKKEELVLEYREAIRKSGALIFTNYRGSSVKQINSLRAKIKDLGGDYVVTKNSLLGIALEAFDSPDTPPRPAFQEVDLAPLGEPYKRAVETCFALDPAVAARRHHALVDARVNRDAWLKVQPQG